MRKRIPLVALAGGLALASAACTPSPEPGGKPSEVPPAPTTHKEDATVSKKPDPMPAEDRLVLSDEEWKRRLTPEQYHVCREKGTERAFSGAHWDTKKKGAYLCVACGHPLFSSETKFDSGTGWPSFSAPIEGGKVRMEDDSSFFMSRTEVLCARCDSHLGHVFDDGPAPTGKRYCMNSVALRFEEKKP